MAVEINFQLGPLSLGLSRLFREGVSVFLAGPSGVGKTSFKLVLKRVELAVLRELESTTGNDSEVVYYQIGNRPRTVPVWCYDFGGDEKYRSVWHQAIVKHLPLGIIYVLDHQNHKKMIYKLLENQNLRITRDNVEEVLQEHHGMLGRITEERIKEHRKYIAHLTDFLREDKKLRRHLRIFIVIVNKRDLWGKYHSMRDFEERFESDFLDIQNMGVRMLPWIATSTYENAGIQKAMEQLLRHAGREFRFFGLKFYWKKSFIE